ncbi:Ribonuclease J [Candidatus Cyrtobacter comes]|uniref:Ribonuclease J n=1 Tax=Candidatus Cyrtobacter comes TaxID=675776 RepID=A0ABU5L8L4_9RICK|nr:ribonuclease J [Candidatus Cyrtobacter comes]MDZ5762467.1 Ribonuclease J [Candidatus Cyrtobacter comes]
MNLKKYKNAVLFIPLGGAGEIGMNLNVYICNERILIVDIGIGFADERFPGIDIIIPDISFLREYRENIDGVVLTHAHEDHIGGCPYILDELCAPVYTTKFTAAVLRAKLREHGMDKEISINEVEKNSSFMIGEEFEIEMVHITHSVPENNGVLIKTRAGNIFHTGDWKFDEMPAFGSASNYDRLISIGKDGVLAMVCDSTNIFEEDEVRSESLLRDSLINIISSINEGLIAVTTFASNIARLISIYEAAKKANRQVVLIGRALWRMYNAAKEVGFLDESSKFLDIEEAGDFQKQNLLIVCTGCQGEPLAATNKLANDEFKNISLTSGDTAIFSSKIIPGNEKRIFALFNKFCDKGVKVITEKNNFVHLSGHPSKREVKEMYGMIKPKIAIPVHGEAIHIAEHANIAEKLGCEYSFKVKNGDVVLLNEEPYKLGRVQSGYSLIDGNSILGENSAVIKERKKMMFSGVIFVSLFIIKGSAVYTIDAPGLFDEEVNKDVLKMVKNRVNQIILEAGSSLKNKVKSVERSIISSLKKLVKNELGKQPLIICSSKMM